MSERPRDRWAHRPHLDGLRALAVYLVVAFHAGSHRAVGGFIGVDVFFVLSGYLVTRLLLRDLQGEGGRIRFGRFYARRARRLLPAALTTLLATIVVYRAIADPFEVAAAADAIRAAALYVANWHFIAEATDYFAEDVARSPVLHFWSLSIEEQFYLLWPLLFAGLHRATARAGRDSRRLLQGAVAALALASVTAALALATSRPDRAYFGTDTRAYQLLAGALLAISPGVVGALRRLARRVGGARADQLVQAGALAALGGLVVLATPAIDVEPIRRGVLATALTVAALVAIEAAEGGPARRLLSQRQIGYLGRISYGTYLWHWLVILVIDRYADITRLAMTALAAVLGTALAALSFEVVESPIRFEPRLDRWRRPVIAVGLAMSLLVGLVVAPAALDRPPGAQAAAQSREALPRDDAAPPDVSGTPEDEQLLAARADTFDYDACPSSAGELCTLADGDGSTAVVVGDSHAGVWATVLDDLAARHDVRLLGGLLSYCPWPRGIRFAMAGPNCFEDQDDVYDRLIQDADPDIVFLAHRPVDDANDPLPVVDRDRGRIDGAERDDALAERTEALVEELVADGRQVVIFEPTPVAPTDLDPLSCLVRSDTPTRCRWVAAPSPSTEDQVLREIAAANPGTVTIDADGLACPYFPICDPVIDGVVVWRDGNHLTATYVESLVDDLDAYLTMTGVFEA